ncbi:MAG: hypothetical protein HY010_07245 [Acidobacteria bacterium]|nr:hypothetical protein [Acidobacteriota bacterium]
MDPMDRDREVEQWLDVALRAYGKVESRTGLESRVLANLQAEKRRLAVRRWWWTWGTAAAAVTILATLWIEVHNRRSVPNQVAGSATTQPTDDAALHQPAPPRSLNTGQAQVPSRAARPRKQAVAVRTGEPKLDQFPSPVPLTDQEKLLAQYVREFPERAVLVARAQTHLRKQEERDRAAPRLGPPGPTDSDQPE